MFKAKRFFVDFRSDTVTQPTTEMLQSVLNIKQFDDCVLGIDKNVDDFEREMARQFNKESALFMLSGTMANQISMLSASSQYARPQSVVGHRNCHLMRWESSGLAFNSRAFPIMVPEYKLEAFKKHCNIVPDTHVARTKILLLENTIDGQVVDHNEMKSIYDFGKNSDMHIHLDGCRIWHAAIKESKPLSHYGNVSDSISICFSKALGAPVGAMLLGSKSFIANAIYYRKMLGGATRQASEQCRYAFNTNYNQLYKTHDAALQFYNNINPKYRSHKPDTNIVFLKNVPDGIMQSTSLRLLAPNNGMQRIVFHLQNILEVDELTRLYQ